MSADQASVYSQDLNTIEEACAELQNNSNGKKSELLLLNLKTRPDLFELARFVLETKSSGVAKFFIAKSISENIIESYSIIGFSHVLSRRDWLIEYLIKEFKNLDNFVIDTISWSIALLTKRTWIDLSISERSIFTHQLCEMFKDDNYLIAISIASQLIEEFTCNFNSSRIHLSWEFHFHSKKAFQNESLLPLLQACLLELSKRISDPAGSDDSEFPSLIVAEKTLHWNFIKEDAQSKNEGTGDSLEYKKVLFPSTWVPVLLEPKVLYIFFEIYRKLSNSKTQYGSSNRKHLAAQCLIQLCSIKYHNILENFPTNEKISIKLNHIQTVMSMLVTMINLYTENSNTPIEEVEFDLMVLSDINKYFISSLLQEPSYLDENKQLVSSAEYLFTRVPLITEYLTNMSHATRFVLEATYSSLKDGTISSMEEFDESFLVDSISNFMETWVEIVEKTTSWNFIHNQKYGTNHNLTVQSEIALKHISTLLEPIYQKYVEIYMFMSVNNLCPFSIIDVDSGKIINESENQYENSFLRQIPIVVRLIRTNTYVFMEKLYSILLLHLKGLSTADGQLSDQLINMVISQASNNMPQPVYRLLSWIIAMIGYIMADISKSEKILVPLLTMKTSVDYYNSFLLNPAESDTTSTDIFTLNGNSNVASLQTSRLSNTSRPNVQTDPLVKTVHLILAALKFINSDTTLSNSGTSMLAEYIFSFFKRVTPVYFMIDEEDYEFISQTFVYAFGKPSNEGNGTKLLSELLPLSINALSRWYNDENVASAIVKMLFAFSKSPSLKSQIINCTNYKQFIGGLVALLERIPPSQCSDTVYVICALSITPSNQNPQNNDISIVYELANKYFFNDFSNLNKAFNLMHILPKADANQFKLASTKLAFGLDVLEGLFKASHPSVVWEFYFEITRHVLSNIGNLMQLFYKDQDVILRLLRIMDVIVMNQELAWFTEVEFKTKYKSISTSEYPAFDTIRSSSIMLDNIIRDYRYAKEKYEKETDVGEKTRPEVEAIVFLQNCTLIGLISQLSFSISNIWPNGSLDKDSRNLMEIEVKTINTIISLIIDGIHAINSTVSLETLSSPSTMDPYISMLKDISSVVGLNFWHKLSADSCTYILYAILIAVDLPVSHISINACSVINHMLFYCVFSRSNQTNLLKDSKIIPILVSTIPTLLEKLVDTVLFTMCESSIIDHFGLSIAMIFLSNKEFFEQALRHYSMKAVSDQQVRISSTFQEFYRNLYSLTSVKVLLDTNSQKDASILHQNFLEMRLFLYAFVANSKAILNIK